MTIIPGLLGMNVGGVPLAHHDTGFWIVVLLVLSVAGAGAFLIFTRTKAP